MGENSVDQVQTTTPCTSPSSHNDSLGSSGRGQASIGSPPPTASGGPYTVEYLAQLLKDKKQLAAFPSNVFHHIERLVDEEISKVRIALFQFEFTKDVVTLPEAEGEIITMQEKVFVPAKEYPDYNFVGRILGPRGMTAKQLEQETGCKIMVRGKGSMRDKKKEDGNRGKPNWEHLQDELHVLIQCEDTPNRAELKLKRAIQEVRKLLIPAPEGEDELKRKQLMELAIINGTYRPANQGKIALQTPRLMTPMTLASPLRSPTLGAPIILSPGRPSPAAAALQAVTPSTSVSLPAAAYPGLTPTGLPANLIQPSPTSAVDYTGQFFINSLDAATLAAMQNAAGYQQYAAAAAMLGNPFLGADYQTVDMSGGALLSNQRRIIGQARDHPYQRKSPHT